MYIFERLILEYSWVVMSEYLANSKYLYGHDFEQQFFMLRSELSVGLGFEVVIDNRKFAIFRLYLFTHAVVIMFFFCWAQHGVK